MTGHFPTTIWDDIRSARDGGGAGLDALLGRYRGPILGFLKWKGCADSESEDIAQEVLLRVSRREFLDRIDPARGRFRSLLLAVTRNVLSEARRRPQPLRQSEMSDSTTALDERTPADEGEIFDRLWVRELVARAMKGLAEHSASRGIPYDRAFELKYVDDLSQEEVARRLGCPLSDAKNRIYYGKLKFKELLLQAVRAYCADEAEFESELARLGPFMKEAAG